MRCIISTVRVREKARDNIVLHYFFHFQKGQKYVHVCDEKSQSSD